MTALRVELPPELNALRAAVGGPVVVSWSLALWSFPFTVLTVVWVGFVLTGFSWRWFAVAAGAHLVMLLLGLVVRPWLLMAMRTRPRPGLALTFFAAAGLLRGVTSSLLIMWLGLQPAAELVYRPLGGAVLMVVTGTLLSWAIDGTRRQRQLMSELRSTGAALAASRDDISALLEAERRQILAEVDQLLAEPIAELRTGLGQSHTDPAAALERIDQLIDDVVKPFSRQLATAIRAWRPVEAVEPAPVRRPLATRGLAVRRPMMPRVQAVTAAALAPSVLAVEMAPDAALLATALYGVAIWVVLGGVAAVWGRFIGPREFWPSLGLTVLFSGLTIAPVMAVLRPFLDERSDAVGYTLGAWSTILVLGVVILVVSALLQQQDEAEAELRLRNADLAVEVPRVSGQLWAQQNQIAQVLHGRVQGALIVALARLGEVSRGEISPMSAAELLVPVDEALAELTAAAEPDVELGLFLQQLQTVWSGVLELSIEVNGGVIDRLAGAPGTTAVVVAILRELVNNAYRHGRSTRVRVNLFLDGGHLLGVRVFSDGAGEGASGRTGLGTRLLDATAASWSRDIGPDGVWVAATFPLTGTQRLLPQSWDAEPTPAGQEEACVVESV